MDTTSVCPVSRYETARPRAAQAPGSAAQQAARRKRWKVYPELVAAQRCKLVVLGFEFGGRMDAEAFGFIRRLAASNGLEGTRIVTPKFKLQRGRSMSSGCCHHTGLQHSPSLHMTGLSSLASRHSSASTWPTASLVGARSLRCSMAGWAARRPPVPSSGSIQPPSACWCCAAMRRLRLQLPLVPAAFW